MFCASRVSTGLFPTECNPSYPACFIHLRTSVFSEFVVIQGNGLLRPDHAGVDRRNILAVSPLSPGGTGLLPGRLQPMLRPGTGPGLTGLPGSALEPETGQQPAQFL